jgi:prepilin-type N-terminal cleavage/methylation domain-containing protein
VTIPLRGSDRTANKTAVDAARPRHGFGLVEVIVAMVLLAVAVSSLAALVFSVSDSGMRTTGDAYKNGVLMHEVNRLEGLPYDSIPNGTIAYAVSTGSYPHSRIVTIAEPVVNIKNVRIVISPSNSKYKPDTVQFLRTRARTSKVLCTTCQ